jgi:L-asparaginase
MRNSVHFIKAGGTIEFIDPSYDAMNDNMFKLDSTIDDYIKNIIKPHFQYSIESIAEKDSRDITDEDRQKIVNAIDSSPDENIIVTQGTFTMKQTAQYIEQHMKSGKKKVILTGSMIPVKGFVVSDAGFNLGFSVASLWGGAEPGVYICMNGGLFKPNEVDKNVDAFRFE